MKLNTPTLTPDEFVKRWRNADANERQSYQEHFRDVCHLIGAKTPGELQQFDDYTFEYGLKKTDGRQGYADVFLRNHFAIEYKGRDKYKDLRDAYRQLQQYRENLNNPYLLIVCDIDHWEIRTNFTNTPVVETIFKHEDLLKPHFRTILRRVFSDPASFHPEKNKLQITEDVAGKFKSVVDDTLERQNDPERVARFMTKLVFCMFVEDIGLLPKRAYDGILTEIVRTTRFHRNARELFPRYMRELFDAMATGGNVQMLDIPYFNGSMFSVGDADIVPLGSAALNALDQASDRNWAHVEPSVFGTIFERTLDDKKRAQLGAHYTHPDDIQLIVKPVLMQPLEREWAALQTAAAPIRERFVKAQSVVERLSAQTELAALRA
ncbi:MAG: class I SAM-dependent DNA methyltransferase, partial [Anaerolinea sp.]|nr:class I SAM-dependent DNA methyltransferase [Anaerolinea sp.]